MSPQHIPGDAVDRVRYMEQIFDELLATAPDSLNPEKLACLLDYYDNGQWMADYELDEAGLLPPGLKRGVLSEDGVFNLLALIRSSEENEGGTPMKTDPKTLEMIRRLADAPGASGFEEAVTAVAWEYAAPIGEIKEDFIRNLYIYRKENTGNKPVLMLDAHADEIGFMVHSIKPNGCLRFVSLGRWSNSSLPSTKVLVRNAKGEYIPGIIAAKPVHFMSAAEKAGQNADISSMVIDIGACSYEEAVNSFHIRIGEPVVPATTFAYDEERDLMFGKAFDCRIGCAALLEALLRLQGRELPCDVVGVLSAQEEVGDRGCKVAAARVKPDVAVVLEGCPADDTFTEAYAIQTALRKGPMFRHMDVSAICSPRFQRFTLDLAREKGIPVQESVREGGGNNSAAIQTTGNGAPAVVAGVPVRYIHSANCMTTGEDFEATVQMVMALLENVTPEVIASL